MVSHWLPNKYQRKTLSVGMGNNIWPVSEPVPKIIIILLCSLPISFIRVSKKWRNRESSCRKSVITINREKILFSLFPAVVFPHLRWMQQINLSYLSTLPTIRNYLRGSGMVKQLPTYQHQLLDIEHSIDLTKIRTVLTPTLWKTWQFYPKTCHFMEKQQKQS